MKTKTGPYPTPYIDVYINVLCTYKTIPEKRSSSVCLSPFNHSKEKSFQNNLGPKTMNKEQALKTGRLCNLQQWIWLFSNRFKIYNYLKSKIIMRVLFMILGLDDYCKALFEAQLINVSMFVEFGSLTNIGSATTS